MKRIFAGLAFAVAFGAQAATYYLSDCQAGAAVGCVAGNDSNAGTSASAPWRSTAKLQAAFNAGKPGDQFLLARGGAWANVNMVMFNFNGGAPAAMIANPTVIDSYAPSWGSTAKPILAGLTGESLFDFTNSGPPDANGGHVLKNLSLKGDGVGVRLFNGVQNITLENLTVDGFSAGVACGGVVDPATNPSSITVRNSTFTNNRAIAIGMWGCYHVLVEGNTLDNNGFERPMLDHPIYISGNSYGSTVTDVVIRNNRLTNNSVSTGYCRASVIVGHDVGADWIIENNYIYQAPNTSYPTCWGISFSPANGGYLEGMDRMVIRGNTLVNVGNNAIEIAACRTCLIENNVIVWETITEAAGIRHHIAPTTPTYVGTALTIRNNSIYFFGTNDVSRGIIVNDQGTNHVVVSNLIYFGVGSFANACFETNLADSAFTAWGNNLCFRGPFGKTGPGDLATNPQLAALPSLANNFSMAVLGTSPANAAGHATRSASRDKTGCKRPALPGIGAFDAVAVGCAKPAATATGLR